MNRLTLRSPGSSPAVISILSGKGGVGKSLVTFNLAHQLAEEGFHVLLVDADFSSGNLHIFGNVRCEFGVRQYLAGELSLPEATATVTESIDLLGASLRGAVVDGIDVRQTAELINRLRREASSYDYILIDHASGVTRSATVMAHGSDINLLVVVPELTSIADAYGLYKFLIETNRSLDCRLLVNRCQGDDEAGYIREKFTALAGRFLAQAPTFVGQLAETGLARRALAAQLPLLQIDPDNSVGQQLSLICRRLTSAAMSDRAPFPAPAEIDNKKTPAAADIEE